MFSKHMFGILLTFVFTISCAPKDNLMNYGSSYEKLGPNDDSGAGPKKIGAWSTSGALFTLDTKAVSAQAFFDEPGVYTVQIALEPKVIPLASTIECEALITWSVAGNDVTRRVTVGNGVSIQGNAESVRVVVADKTSTGLAGTEYNVSILIVTGTRPVTSFPPTLVPTIVGTSNNPVILAPNGGTVDFLVPQRVGVNSVMVTVSDSVPGPVTNAIVDQQPLVEHIAPGIIGNLKSYDCRAGDFVPLAPGTEVVRLTNKAAAGGRNFRFQVTFGVDG